MKAALTNPPAADPARTLIAPVPHPATSIPTRVMPPARTHVLSPPTQLAPARGSRLTRHHALGALAALAALAGAVVVLTTVGQDAASRRVGLPKLVGMPVAKARSALLKDGFVVRVAARRHSGQSAGSVAGVRPRGASAARGALVTLIPSSGPAPIVVPALTGFSLAAATRQLERLGFVVHSSTAYASAPAGTALGTAPTAGTPVTPHSSISLVISAGPQPIVPPEPAPPGKAKDKHHEKKHAKPKKER
jgi:serine/threonine-protein kinase